MGRVSQCEQIGTRARTNGLVMEGAKHALTARIGLFLLGVTPFTHETEVGHFLDIL